MPTRVPAPAVAKSQAKSGSKKGAKYLKGRLFAAVVETVKALLADPRVPDARQRRREGGRRGQKRPAHAACRAGSGRRKPDRPGSGKRKQQRVSRRMR